MVTPRGLPLILSLVLTIAGAPAVARSRRRVTGCSVGRNRAWLGTRRGADRSSGARSPELSVA